ncbi:MAG TPA: right-handed parallel beta-helix repeat-containing protein [Gemmatimonadales bacterium]|nr:right-handed parallel beta-helix repeat-containing protein [Gemmatimonadales bacterium]
MRPRLQRSSAALLGGLSIIALLASCSDDAPTAPDQAKVSLTETSSDRLSVCHSGGIITVSPSQLATHLGHGDYLTSLAVSHASDQPKDGAHFRRIGDALTVARDGRKARGELASAACRITITVAAGVYRGTDDLANTDESLERFPFEVDVPAITLRGALVMRLDASGRATGTSTTGRATTLAPIEPLSDLVGFPAIFAAYGDGNGLTVQGFAFQSGQAPGTETAGTGVISFTVTGLTIRGNRLEGFFETIDLRGSNAIVETNHISEGGQCAMCLAGPGVYRAEGNKIVAGGTHGIFTSPAIDAEPDGPGFSKVFVDIIDNEVRNVRQQPISAGIRVGAVGLGAPNVPGSSHIKIRDNLLVNNNFGLMIDALFPQPDTRLRGDIEVTTSGNVVRESCQADLLVGFSRHYTNLGAGGDPYLLNSTYKLTLSGDWRFSDAWFSNPPGFGNTLLVNGREIGHRTRAFYDPESCPARQL